MTEAAKTSPLLELLINIVIPSVILMKWSGPEYLGAMNALLLALAFPLTRGAIDLIRLRKLNLFAGGLVSILRTGGIGLLALDPRWLAVKEAAIPRDTFQNLLGPAKQTLTQYLPQIRQQAETLDRGRVMNRVRDG